MDFKLVKPVLKKPLIWMGAIIFTTIIILFIVVFTISIDKKQKVIWSCQLVLNFLVIYFISIVLNFSKTSVTLFNDIHTTTNLETNVISVEVKSSRYIHIFIIFFAVICFFIHLTSGAQIQKLKWADYASGYWWAFIIVMVYNLVYFYIFFNINSYLLNNNDKFKKNYINFYKKSKEQIENKKSDNIKNE
ncbi:hypothetical protein [Spiroplasma tabanidicola]|uniref:Transmembrane protein n=1 Tax=Spiroplasma tabanidicola TaxID=324079 RepID=A0A6I6CBS2_9MOLU|nr:hypothetical protein [Spiroplasma tabanidicola]QGS51542.1 hypothetical protein STABA_v1c01750 [Spiroplasma tabanidicola]